MDMSEDRTEGLFQAVGCSLSGIKFLVSAIKPSVSPQYLTELVYVTDDNFLYSGTFQNIDYLVVVLQTCQIFSDCILG
jgi:hypothetical protein